MVRLLDFYDEGLCGQVDGDAFFPESRDESPFVTKRSFHTTKMAKAVCEKCPVRPLCLKWALDNPVQAGEAVWGGYTWRERKRLITPGWA